MSLNQREFGGVTAVAFIVCVICLIAFAIWDQMTCTEWDYRWRSDTDCDKVGEIMRCRTRQVKDWYCISRE